MCRGSWLLTLAVYGSDGQSRCGPGLAVVVNEQGFALVVFGGFLGVPEDFGSLEVGFEEEALVGVGFDSSDAFHGFDAFERSSDA